MATIAENLQTLIALKGTIKAALESQGKEPGEKLSDYVGLINDLENPEKVVYCLTIDGEQKTFTQLYGEQKVELTATENDIRKGSTAITKKGYLEGEKVIPAYNTSQGFVVIPANSECKIESLSSQDRYAYTKLQAIITPFNTSLSNSVAVNKVVIDDYVYNVNSTEKVSNVTKDDENKSISFGIINEGNTPMIIRYFTYKEVP